MMMTLACSTKADSMETEAQQNMRECVKRTGARVEAPSTGRGQLTDGGVLHCQRKMDYRNHGGSH